MRSLLLKPILFKNNACLYITLDFFNDHYDYISTTWIIDYLAKKYDWSDQMKTTSLDVLCSNSICSEYFSAFFNRLQHSKYLIYCYNVLSFLNNSKQTLLKYSIQNDKVVLDNYHEHYSFLLSKSNEVINELNKLPEELITELNLDQTLKNLECFIYKERSTTSLCFDDIKILDIQGTLCIET